MRRAVRRAPGSYERMRRAIRPTGTLSIRRRYVAKRPARPAPRGDATLERLLDGGLETLRERGYGASSISEICARSRVGIGTFYAHFERKRDLLRRVFVDRAVPFSRQVTPADFLDHARLVISLRSAVDDPIKAGLFRAWYEAVL